MISANHVNWSLIGPQFTMELQGAVSLWCRTERCWFSQNHILNIKTGNVNELKMASTVHICYYSNCLIRTSSITLHSWSIRLHLLSVFLSLPACLPACLCVSFSLLLCFCPSLYPRPPNLPSHTLCLTHLLSARQVSVAKRQAMSDGLLLWERRLSIMISHLPVPDAYTTGLVTMELWQMERD